MTATFSSGSPEATGVHSFTSTLSTDGDLSVRVAGYFPHSHPLRLSLVGSYSNSTALLDALTNATSLMTVPAFPPPAYDKLPEAASPPPSRLRITPREEEGREQLPDYYCSVHKEGVFHRKMEFTSPFDRATDRKWKKEYVVLHGTLLKIHKPKRVPFFSKPEDEEPGEDGSIRPIGWQPGEVLRQYTLQGAEVGVAGDYKKRHFVIRIRAEAEQFLLSLKRVEEFITWLEALSSAIDLSPSLDERSLPRYHTVPRRRRRRASQVIRHQERLLRQHYPQLSSEDSDHQSRRDSFSLNREAAADDQSLQIQQARRFSLQESIFDSAEVEGLQGARPVASQRRPQSSRQAPSGAQSTTISPLPTSAAMVSSPSTSSATSNSTGTTSTSMSSTLPVRHCEKKTVWQPSTSITPEFNLRYARRCMTVLCADAPRRSDYVVQDGLRYRIVWSQKLMVPVGPSVDLSRLKGSEVVVEVELGGETGPAKVILPGLPTYEEAAYRS